MHGSDDDDLDVPQWLLEGDDGGQGGSWIADEVIDAENFLVGHIADELLRDPDVRAGELIVGVQNGVVILEGEVESPDTVSAAGRCAWSVPGVRDVCNMLVVQRGHPTR